MKWLRRGGGAVWELLKVLGTAVLEYGFTGIMCGLLYLILRTGSLGL